VSDQNEEHDEELDALLGAYALDALDGEERERVEAYVAANRQARDEVDELRESAASLALLPETGADTSAPPELWDRISVSISNEPQAAPIGTAAARRSGNSSRVATWLAVAAAIVLVVVAVQTVVVGRSSKAGNTAAAFEHAKSQSGAREVSLNSTANAQLARVVMLPDGTGYLKNDGLPALDSTHTYQLWLLTGAADHPVAISAGVLGPHPKAVAFHAGTGVHGLGLTVEESPGVVQTTQPMVARASL
jgi:anti-sigma-K factor RskA